MNTHKHLVVLAIGLALSGAIGGTAIAQPAVPTALAVPAGDPPLSNADLQTLVGPIALYPDDLVGIILPASTYPLQVVQAARFLDRTATESGLTPDPDWDNAVVALLNYPEVLRLMDENLDWTWALGESVLSQQADVIDAIQDFREDAYLAGNLRSDERQFVTQNDGAIEIKPADPQVIYIPYYEPERVVVVQPRPVYFYYADPYPLYYYPYPVGYRFGTGFFWGVTSVFGIGWHTHYVNVYHHRHVAHPYYNRSYYAPYYARRGVNININVNNVTHVWQPSERRAARPQYRNERDRVVYSRERYTDDLRRSTQTRRETNTIGVAPTRNETRTRSVESNGGRGVQGGIATAPSQDTRQRSPRAVPGNTRSVDRNTGAGRIVESERGIGSVAPRERPVIGGGTRNPIAVPNTRSASPQIPGNRQNAPSAAPQTRAPQATNRDNVRVYPGNGADQSGRPPRAQAPARVSAVPRERPAAPQTSTPRQSAPRQSAPSRTPTFAPSNGSRNAAPQARRDGGGNERTRTSR